VHASHPERTLQINLEYLRFTRKRQAFAFPLIGSGCVTCEPLKSTISVIKD
jgi:hypothetical protein